MARLLLIPIIATALAIPSVADAQGTTTLRGVAFDSVSMRPLPGALVTLDAVRTAFADDSGRFSFDDVAAGPRLIEMTHAALDSMGLPGIALRMQVADGIPSVTIAVPSFATLWRAACGDRPAPADSGFVYGRVRSALDGREVAAAAIALTWSEFALRSMREITGRRLRAETETDANGEYSVCGVPLDVGLRVQATRESLVSADIALGPTLTRILRRDLLIGPRDTAAATLRGSIQGTVRRAQGGTIQGATVVLDDVPGPPSRGDGRFHFPDVPPGTHQIEVISLGYRPTLLVVDVIGGQQTVIEPVMERLSTLDAIRITGSRFQARMLEQLDDRKHQGFGTFLDSSAVGRRGTIAAVMSGLPSVDIRYRRATDLLVLMPGRMGGQCAANLLLDGRRSDAELLAHLVPEDIAVVEVYPRAYSVPIELMRGTNTECGLVAIWTKQFLQP